MNGYCKMKARVSWRPLTVEFIPSYGRKRNNNRIINVPFTITATPYTILGLSIASTPAPHATSRCHWVLTSQGAPERILWPIESYREMDTSTRLRTESVITTLRMTMGR